MVPVTSVGADSPVDGIVATVPIVLSLLVAVWALVAAVRHRPPDRVQFVGLAVLEVALLVLSVLALVAVGGGDRPGEPGAFFGYLVTLVCLPPLAWVLARMEPTRWGSAIVCAVCLVTPVVVVRLQQTWEVLGG
ncbi:hypothetical protein GAR06_05964 [Micromonospora saelicesensis]|uniref:Uncharacterized protein n=2 Tax=Micromonospora TaxID=1873 RepID=A0A1C4ZJ06_9ACTN|nr:hypothetical protein GAR05_03207 [Micromonospora saelicesensis]RAO02639.1 hypothetical protein LAH08_02148 [Micromonospora noduli]RAO32261.1 hypothetical protein PSN13_03953 [Micromonospora saelicesensis]RAO41016.1 hypothetical protein GAR06_05964 [Micromonospora saelicesensis]RAO45490.1 hypothetical protein PSN01_05350 [Micromonospora saelicesensis]